MRLTPGPGAAIVAALGVTQIIGYGTLYYAFPILAPAVAAEFGVGEPVLFAILSAGLLLGGLAAPVLGRLLDSLGAGRVMTAGSLAMAALTAGLSAAPNIATFAGLTLLIEMLSFAVLYDAAFAALAQKRPGDTRRAITSLTLIAGFASTIFWPLSGWLSGALGWRGTILLFAGLHLFLAAPLHLWLGRRPLVEAAAQGRRPPPSYAPLEGALARQAFVLLGASFAMTGMAISALSVHLVPVLLAQGLGGTAYLAAMVMGPAQVMIRVVDATVFRSLHPMAVALVSAAAIPLALAVLLLPGPAGALAFVFAFCFGAGQGLSSIVRGAVPVALFGTAALGLRLGRLAAIRSVLGAASPFLFSWLSTVAGMGTGILGALCLGLAGFVSLLMLWTRLGRAGLRRPRDPVATPP